jgi:hypothetical protein
VDEGLTPLLVAVKPLNFSRACTPALLAALLAAGADPTASDLHGKTPLHVLSLQLTHWAAWQPASDAHDASIMAALATLAATAPGAVPHVTALLDEAVHAGSAPAVQLAVNLGGDPSAGLGAVARILEDAASWRDAAQGDAEQLHFLAARLQRVHACACVLVAARGNAVPVSIAADCFMWPQFAD